MEILKFLSKLFKKSAVDNEAWVHYRKMRAKEGRSKEQRIQDKERRKEEDKARAYRERDWGAEKAAEDQEQYRAEKGIVIKEKAKDDLGKAMRGEKGYRSADYLFHQLSGNTALTHRLESLIYRNADAAEIISSLAEGDASVHNNPQKLIRLGTLLASIAKKEGMVDTQGMIVEDLIPFFKTLAGRVNGILSHTLEAKNKQLREQGLSPPAKIPSRLLSDLSPFDDEQLAKIRSDDEDAWTSAIEEVFVKPRTLQDVDWASDVQSHAQQPKQDDKYLPQGLINRLNNEVLLEIERREAMGQFLSASELEEMEIKVDKIGFEEFPKDVAAGTSKHTEAAQAIRDRSEAIKEILAQKAVERRRREVPVMTEEVSPDEFLGAYRAGDLGRLLYHNPKIRKLIVGHGVESERFRMRLFLKMHSGVLTQRRESFQENFGLYERADFTNFINLLRAEMYGTRPETGVSFAQSWIEWYSGLSNSIRLARDIDFWASQPGSDPQNFQRAIALYQNEYNVQAMSIPGVEQGFRAYWSAIRAIKAYNNGYIPPGMVEYHAGRMVSDWDNWARTFLQKKFDAGLVYDIERDKYGFHKTNEQGIIKLDEDKALKWDDLEEAERYMYLTLGKGFGISSWALLDEFANSKAPGSDHPQFGMPGFHSIAGYEGVARAGNFIGQVIDKWKFGGPIYFHFMNMLLPEHKRKKEWHFDDARRAYIAYRNGTFAEEYGEDAKRFIDLLNFSHFSANLPYSSWRHVDTTRGWSDKMREELGSASQVLLAGGWAEEKVKDYLVVGKYREKFREVQERLGRDSFGPGFDRLWQSEGLSIYGAAIENDWDKVKHEASDLIEKYKKAFIARVWIETAMRNPLAVAHNIDISVDIPGYQTLDKKKTIKLHSLLLQEILEIPIEDLEYGEISTSREVTNYTTPNEEQRRLMIEASDFEADLLLVKELAMNKERELTVDDFKIIKDPVRRKQALKYWERVRQLILGTTDTSKHTDLYKRLGIELDVNGMDYNVDWEKKIKNIDRILKGLAKENREGIVFENIHGIPVRVPFQLTEKLINKEWEVMFSADDFSIRKMDWINLGSRQMVRRAGDAAAHFAGGERLGTYLTNDIVPNAQPEDLAKALKEVVMAYAGDDVLWGWRAAGIFAYLTGRLYSFDYKRLGSPAQFDIWKTRRGVAAWHANGRRKFVDTLEQLNVLSPHPDTYMDYAYTNKYYNINELRDSLKATTNRVWLEILLLGYVLAIAMTLYRAFTAKDEEES